MKKRIFAMFLALVLAVSNFSGISVVHAEEPANTAITSVTADKESVDAAGGKVTLTVNGTLADNTWYMVEEKGEFFGYTQVGDIASVEKNADGTATIEVDLPANTGTYDKTYRVTVDVAEPEQGAYGMMWSGKEKTASVKVLKKVEEPVEPANPTITSVTADKESVDAAGGKVTFTVEGTLAKNTWYMVEEKGEFFGYTQVGDIASVERNADGTATIEVDLPANTGTYDKTYRVTADVAEPEQGAYGMMWSGKEKTASVKVLKKVEEPAEPAFDNTKFSIKVVDQDENPVSGVSVYLKGAYSAWGSYDIEIPGTSDESGLIECDVNDLDVESIVPDEDYELALVEGSDYEAEDEVTLAFGEDDDWNLFLEYVGMDEYTEETGDIIFTVSEKEAELPAPAITSVTATPGTVASTGGTVTVTVKGENLPETLYYKRTYEYAGNYGSMEDFYTDGYNGKSTATEGSATERTFELSLPATSELAESGATKWFIAVDPSGNDGFTKRATVLIEEAEVPAEPVITSVTATPGTVSPNGGNVTVTVTGENLPETLYYKRTYEYAGTYGPMDGYYTDGYSGKSTTTEGSATERTFELSLPATSELTDKGVTKWFVAVDLSGYDGFKNKATVLIEEEPEEPANPTITAVTADKESVDAAGGKVTFTVEGTLAKNTWYMVEEKGEFFGWTQVGDVASVERNADGTATIELDLPANTGTYDKTYKVTADVAEPEQGTYGMMWSGKEKTASVKVLKKAEEPVEPANPTITSVTADKESVDAAGGKVTFTVEGTLAKNTWYMVEEKGEFFGYTQVGEVASVERNADGTATIEVDLPANTGTYDKTYRVTADVAEPEQGAYGMMWSGKEKTASVKVLKKAEEPAKLEITSVTADKDSFTSEGGTLTITVNGNLGDKVWYATQFNVSGGSVYNDLDYYASSVTPNEDGTATITITVPKNTTSQKKYYRVRMQLVEPKLDEVETSLVWSEDVKDVHYTVETSKVNKYQLDLAITDAGFLKEAEYTAASWKALEDAVAAGTAVYADDAATQEQVDAAAKAIRDAIAALEEGSPAVTIEATVEIEDDQFVYDGNAVEPKVVSVKDSEGKEIAEENYEVSYDADCAEVGKHNVTVTFKGAYAGEAEAEYVVVPAEVEGLKGFRYQVGNRVKLEWKESAGATGYKVQYKSAKSSKTYTKYVTTLSDVKNNLTCSKTYTFKVTPYFEDENGVKYMASSEMDSVKVSTAKAISKTVGQVYETSVVKSSSSKVKVKWNNVSNETGYQISRSSKADGTYIVKTVKSTSAKSTTVSGGTKGTTYYYKVRAYRTVGTKKVYSDWSETIAFTLE